ncbi:hypothetical protein A2X44_05335 [candidate division CPR3 bacterium GWF2_35_18]|uniref:Uncharacterized protein n=1 Tax=candidate division CPR3 bacterium GW2011_GWF2_35_18 TaxID=1618350 RepID=A0A0G0BZ26_UNCC3|nr:MAG: hypothetical protein UR67_C0009G0013 [candidate division CPR3 bacterium GW2011_GWF2_35_18]OGB63822.1 MAG: hypothetical protein A2X44_05335 [candidate division CPR3 bacterium GWF2_35_18]OGB65209.1 MAG: hypothetical protein A2250_03085 [candidate division CPR3 bacterium RIFOXYA2_FULL_35_13]OGB79412.1 MAG: hypothetical protein A2296_04790 [candidate division CPR3 bacterium RIFOXYB2_FULL_35_8]
MLSVHPQKLSELYPSLASTNGLRAASAELSAHLDPQSPLSEMLALTMDQTVNIIGKLEKTIEENGLEAETPQNPMLPEQLTISRINGVKKGLHSVDEFLNGDAYKAHPKLRNTFHLRESDSNLAPALQISYNNLDLPEFNFIEPDWYGLTLLELKQALTQADNTSRAQQSAEVRFDKNEQRLQGVTSTWERVSPGTIKIAWGSLTGNNFIPHDTHLEINIAYSAQHGYVGIPKFVVETEESREKGIDIVVEGEPFPLNTLNGIPAPNLNKMITEKLKI